MPILPAQTSIFPEDLLEGLCTEESERLWWAVHTKSRQEKALAEQLLRHEVPFYLPLVPKDNQIRGKRVRSHIPVFSGYVFLFGTPKERAVALATNRACQILDVGDQEQLWHDLEQLRRLIATGAPLTIERRLQAGRRVRVKSGPMMGMEGLVIERRNNNRLFVAINFLQQGASVAIDDYILEPIDD